jgi:arylsulfatase A-like enzyme
MNRFYPVIFGLLCTVAPDAIAKDEQQKPNVLIFYIDDMGWAQPGCYGGKLTPTPHIDALAKSGVRFTDGYVSACVCSPSRVGLLTGRYQARSGHDANSNRPGRELSASETTIAQRMRALGYRTGIVGKWHVGQGVGFLPSARGFDFAIGSVGNLGEGGGASFYRGGELVETLPGEPVTSPLYARQACSFIEHEQEQPWFLYLAFNAVHAPHVASEKWLDRFKDLNHRDQKYAGLIAEADEAVGTVMTKLRELSLEENTLVFLIGDNGGAAPQAEMGGLRGRKWFVWEGGVRVPWIVQWKGRIPGGRTVSEPVIQLDALPTALAAAGGRIDPQWQLDGVNLMPLLEAQVDQLPPRELYFRFGVQYAVRSGDWKLVKADQEMRPMLVNLSSDRGEQHDLSEQFPDKKRELQGLFDRWTSTMQPPRWEDARWNGDEARKERKEDQQKKKANRKKKT